MTVEDAYAAARQTGVNLIATLKFAVGDLDKVKRIVKLVGFVNCTGELLLLLLIFLLHVTTIILFIYLRHIYSTTSCDKWLLRFDV